MEFSKLIWERCSVRKYSERPVEEEKLQQVLEAAQAAPTAVNYQPQRILVLRSREAQEKLQGCMKFRFGQPLTLLICYDSRVSWKRGYDGREFGETDAALVTTHVMLQAQELGLSTVWIGSFDPEKVREAFALPEYLVPSAILPLGYEAEAGGHGEKKRQQLQVEYL